MIVGTVLRGKIPETKHQPKEEVFGWTSLRTSGQKLRSGPPNLGKNETSILAWTCHEKIGLKNFGLILVP